MVLSLLDVRFYCSGIFEIASSKAAKIRVELERVGKPIGPFDLLIASQALANKFTLVTNNEKEFARIKEIKMESWL
ncbi:Ribonuclease VapC [Leptospira santarosai]|uniref:Ribonuclease VapC n=1 Tax=Leptospira santarosai TaxID=28183 RepID=A0A2P1QQX0_9LEPT|nr:Ribonuclease VapC [Leptospira santarosai]